MAFSQNPPTIHDQINELRKAQEKQESEALDAIRAIFQNPSEYRIHLPETRSPGLVGRGPGAIAKFSRHHRKFLGWYRAGQRSGKPNSKLPIEAELDAQYAAYYAMLRAVMPLRTLSRQLGCSIEYVRRILRMQKSPRVKP